MILSHFPAQYRNIFVKDYKFGVLASIAFPDIIRQMCMLAAKSVSSQCNYS